MDAHIDFDLAAHERDNDCLLTAAVEQAEAEVQAAHAARMAAEHSEALAKHERDKAVQVFRRLLKDPRLTCTCTSGQRAWHNHQRWNPQPPRG